MKRTTGLLLIAFIAFSCKSEKSNLKSDLETANLKGHVWKIDKTNHEAGKTCGCVIKTECNQSRYIYDKNGNLVQSCSIDENGSIVDSSKYIYDRHGMCLEIDKFSGSKIAGKQVPVIKGKKVTGVKFYDENGNIESTLNYVFSGEEISEEESINPKGEVISTVQKEYLNGQLVSETEKDSNGALKSISKFKRNERNDVVEFLVTVIKENKDYKFTYEYEYDDAGNWIKQTRFYDGQIENIVMRNIQYYKAS